MNDWRSIWERRTLASGPGSLLSRLLATDGFAGLGAVTERAWLSQVDTLIGRLGLRASADSVFEVGCGAGAMLYPFYTRGFVVGGSDYASNLVTLAAQGMPRAEFQHAEAAVLSPEPVFDLVMAHSVFFYFPNYDYAQQVFLRMLGKARKWVCVLDVPDLARQELGLRTRRQAYGAAYDEGYRGLSHLYFPQDWFARALVDQDVSIEIEPQDLQGYLHSSYRFNVYVRKNS